MIYILLETCKGSDNSVPIVLRRNELTIDLGLQDHGLWSVMMYWNEAVNGHYSQ